MSWFLRQTIKTKLSTVGLFIIAVVLVQSVLTWNAVQRDQETFRAQSALQADVTTATRAIEALTTMESAYRGYLLTGDESFVQSFRVEQERLDGFADQLTRTQAGGPDQPGLWRTFRDRAKDWQDKAAQPGLTLRRSVNDGTADFSEVAAYVTEGTGQRLFDQARAAYQQALDGANVALSTLAHDTVEAGGRVEWVIAVTLLLVLIACLLAIILLDRSIAQPLELAVDRANTLAEGSLDVEAFPEVMKMRGTTFRPLVGEGEIARLARALNATIDTFTTVDVQARAIAAGRISDPVLEERVPGELGESLSLMTDNLRHFAALARAVSEGDLTAEGGPVREGDELASIARTMTLNLRAIAENVRSVIQQVSDGAEALADGAEESADLSASVARAVADIKDSIARQATASDDVAGRVEDIAGEVDTTRGALHTAIEASMAATALGNTGRAQVDEVTDAMQAIRSAIEAVADAVSRLESQSRRVGEMVDLIRSVAEQTNLLALNASIEAARAGDAGRGFAVVAAEVKSLSEKAAASTAQIDAIVEQMHEGVDQAGRLMGEGRRQIDHGSQAVARAGVAFNDIADGMEAASGRIERVEEAVARIEASAVTIRARTEELVAGAAGNSSAIEEVAAASEETATTAEETGATAQQLAASGRQLQAAIDRLRLGDAPGGDERLVHPMGASPPPRSIFDDERPATGARASGVRALGPRPAADPDGSSDTAATPHGSAVPGEGRAG